MRQNLSELPPDLPKPNDDGKASHLVGYEIPQIQLQSTQGGQIQIWQAFQEPTVLFIYPRAGSPIEPNKNPELWDATPGARGCTPQSCGFRDLFHDFLTLGVNIYGLSVQSPAVQQEFTERNHIPFPILSDYKYDFTDSLNLPTFDFEV